MALDTSPIDYSELMLSRLTDQVRDLFQRIFETEGSEAGEAWAPLSPITEARKERLGQPTAILVAQDELRRSLAYGVGDGYAELREGGSVLAVGTNDPKGPFHQLGTRRMPQRKIAPDADDIPQSETNDWSALVARHAKNEIGNRLSAAFREFKDIGEGAEGALEVVLEGLGELAEVVVL
jgi:phage gpG-like protein